MPSSIYRIGLEFKQLDPHHMEGDALVDEITASVSTVKKWLSNPLSLSSLKFIATDDKCGNRLLLAIDYYLSEQVCGIEWRN